MYEMGESKMVSSFRDNDMALVYETQGSSNKSEWMNVFVFSFCQNRNRGVVMPVGVPVAVSIKVI
jgi:hypothetical protein